MIPWEVSQILNLCFYASLQLLDVKMMRESHLIRHWSHIEYVKMPRHRRHCFQYAHGKRKEKKRKGWERRDQNDETAAWRPAEHTWETAESACSSHGYWCRPNPECNLDQLNLLHTPQSIDQFHAISSVLVQSNVRAVVYINRSVTYVDMSCFIKQGTT